MIPVDYLDTANDSGYSAMATYNPIYMINWGVMEWQFQAGWENRARSRTRRTPTNVVIVWIDDRLNLACYDRRKQALLTTAIS